MITINPTKIVFNIDLLVNLRKILVPKRTAVRLAADLTQSMLVFVGNIRTGQATAALYALSIRPARVMLEPNRRLHYA